MPLLTGPKGGFVLGEKKALVTDLEKTVADRLSRERWQHTLGTAVTARRLAPSLRADPRKAWVAGLVHDLARDLPSAELLSLARRFGILVGAMEREAPELLHGPVGAELARRELGIDDLEVLDAVARHTVGGPDLSPLALTLYLADFVEPGRRFPGAEEVRRQADRDPELAVLWAMERTIVYLFRFGLPSHPLTVEGRNWLLRKLREEGRWQPWEGGARGAECDHGIS